MKKIYAAILLSSVTAFAQDTGQFEISKTSFKDLFNGYRYASPKIVPWSGNFFPYRDNGTAVKLNKAGDQADNGTSPIFAYSKLPGGSAEAIQWEEDGHGCNKYDAETKKSCESWWGHCNGWAAAAIKEKEPRSSKTIRGKEFTVADQKGILTELWLSSYSNNAGITDKNVKTGKWVHDHDKKPGSYQSFWDVTPRAFFLIFTNYVGVLKTGIVIDRFTGDEVWNQPVVGYRILPIQKTDISQVRDGGRTYWNVKLGMKIYWGNDLGIRHGHVSKAFDIKKMTDTDEEDELSEDYDQRYLVFSLNFDSKVTVSADGTQVLTAGKIVGDGLWEHQEDSRSYTLEDLDHSHPDFIWLPTQAFQDSSGYGNPYMDPEVVQKMTDGRDSNPPARAPATLTFTFATKDLGGPEVTAEEVKKEVQKVLRRDGIKHAIYLKDIEIKRTKITIDVRFPLGANIRSLKKLFEAAGLPAEIER